MQPKPIWMQGIRTLLRGSTTRCRDDPRPAGCRPIAEWERPSRPPNGVLPHPGKKELHFCRSGPNMNECSFTIEMPG
jgi:hypothetical protein